MVYHHRFRVRASVEAVAAFHADPATMSAITPPPIMVQVHRAPVRIADGAGMDFTLWLGPLPLRWQAKFDQVSPTGFRDRQQRGPFSRWQHTHRFEAVTPDTTDVLDTLEIELRRHWLWGPLGWGMARSLPLLLASRDWRTRRLLQPSARSLMAPLLLLIGAATAFGLAHRRLCR